MDEQSPSIASSQSFSLEKGFQDRQERTYGETIPVDYYNIADLLTEDERRLRERVRHFCDRKVIPIAADYWERAEVPFEILKMLPELGIVGGTIKGYGCPALSPTAVGLAVAELARGDGSLHTSFGSHSGLAMTTISLFGSEEQKQRWLPAMARMETIGAFALSEPEHGSDTAAFETSVRRDGDAWVLSGVKKWISNASFADVVLVWARHRTGQIGAFLVDKGTPGFHIEVIKGKASQRASSQSLISLDSVRIPIDNRLREANGFNDVTKVITISRLWVAWAALGHAMACYEYALTYTQKRFQFGKPIAHFQLVQQKLARMLAELTSLQLLCLRASQLMGMNELTSESAALAKMQTALKARQIAADARDLLGSNGMLLEYHVARHQADLEAISSLEGTDHVQALMIGRKITGIQAFA